MAFCKNCGKSVDPNAAVCLACGFDPNAGASFCANCGTATVPGAAICTSCGYALSSASAGGEQKSKTTAGLLGVFLGWTGAHYFYLGNIPLAVAHLALVLLIICPPIGLFALIPNFIWGLVEGILILTGSINRDGKGRSLI